MKTLNVLFSVVLVCLLAYLSACSTNSKNDTITGASNNIESSMSTENQMPPECPIPPGCTGIHYCLGLTYNGEDYDLGLIQRIYVQNTGIDCNQNPYNCFYWQDNPSNPTNAGTLLPSNSTITRYVCGKTHDGLFFEGSYKFNTSNPGGPVKVPIHFIQINNCPEPVIIPDPD